MLQFLVDIQPELQYMQWIIWLPVARSSSWLYCLPNSRKLHWWKIRNSQKGTSCSRTSKFNLAEPRCKNNPIYKRRKEKLRVEVSANVLARMVMRRMYTYFPQGLAPNSQFSPNFEMVVSKVASTILADVKLRSARYCVDSYTFAAGKFVGKAQPFSKFDHQPADASDLPGHPPVVKSGYLPYDFFLCKLQ